MQLTTVFSNINVFLVDTHLPHFYANLDSWTTFHKIFTLTII